MFGLLTAILFVGHSLVGPDMPGLVEAGLRAMDAPAPAPATVQAQVVNGAPLAWNWDRSSEAETDGRAILAEGQITDLVLTEAQPLAGHVEYSDTAGLVARWGAAATDANPGARVWLYETWPAFGAGGVSEWRAQVAADLPLWETAAGEVARIIPAGQAMAALSQAVEAGEVPGLATIGDVFSDEIHPNGKGAYFVAMVQIAALTGRSPEGIPARLVRIWPSRDAVVTDDLAAVFQRIAWQVVRDYEQAPPVMAPPPPDPVQPPDPAPPQAAPDDPAADLTPITNPNLALGLAGVNDWSVQQPFLDVMKTARPWVGHLPGQWGGWEEADLRAAGALDDEGWPIAIPPELSGISTLVLTDLPAGAGGVAGRYVLTYQGRGALMVQGTTVVEDAPGRVVFDYVPGQGAVLMTLTETDATDPLRRIRIVRQDRLALIEAGEIFNPDWLARISGVRLLRFMDWMATNNATLARADDRPRPDDYTWARNGVPVEVMVALANRLHADPWLTLPHLAEDALAREMAAVVARDLDPGLKVWVEYSNEVWNWQFAQAVWADEQARARWGRENAWVQFYALRAAEIMAIWSQALPESGRLVRVIATQTGWQGLEEDILTAPLVVAEGRPAPAQSFDAYAVTGYVSGQIGTPEKMEALRGWLAESRAAAEADAATQGLAGEAAAAHVAAHRFDLAIQRAAAEIADGSVTGQAVDSVAQITGEVFPYHAAVAAKYGLRLVMYEGGTHVVGTGGAVEDDELTAFFTTLNYAPQMGGIYAALMQGWAAVTDAPFNAFVDIYVPNKWGSWGALRHLGDDNPRWQALARGCAPC